MRFESARLPEHERDFFSDTQRNENQAREQNCKKARQGKRTQHRPAAASGKQSKKQKQAARQAAFSVAGNKAQGSGTGGRRKVVPHLPEGFTAQEKAYNRKPSEIGGLDGGLQEDHFRTLFESPGETYHGTSLNFLYLILMAANGTYTDNFMATP